jgi:threonine dehydrogenase-like Zn-dependent dehydrogenase
MALQLIASPAPGPTPQTVHRPQAARRIYLIYIENVAHGACVTAEIATSAMEAVLAAAPPKPGDLVVIGTCHLGLLSVAIAYPSARRLLGSGPDGADLALVEEMTQHMVDRFDELVLVSGDHIFADGVAWLAARGLPTTVVSHPGSLSRELRMAATNIVYLQEVRVPASALARQEAG